LEVVVDTGRDAENDHEQTGKQTNHDNEKDHGDPGFEDVLDDVHLTPTPSLVGNTPVHPIPAL